MCGILGLLAPGTQPDLRGQLDLLIHRGPDEGGCYADTDVFLGARRLSIIDVAGGQQPLSVADGAIWVVQNGEIYNYLALKAELEARGHIFRTHSDTEVIGAAYAEWGTDCAQHLRHLRLGRVGHGPAAPAAGARPLWREAALPGGAAGRGAGVRLGDTAAAGPAARHAR